MISYSLQTEISIGLVCVGVEQWLTKFIYTKLSDHFLGGGVSDKFCECHRTFIIDRGPFVGIDSDDMIHIEQCVVAFQQDLKLEIILVGKVGCAISKDVGVLFGCNGQGRRPCLVPFR